MFENDKEHSSTYVYILVRHLSSSLVCTHNILLHCNIANSVLRILKYNQKGYNDDVLNIYQLFNDKHYTYKVILQNMNII